MGVRIFDDADGRQRVREFLAAVAETDPNEIARLYEFFKRQVGYEQNPGTAFLPSLRGGGGIDPEKADAAKA